MELECASRHLRHRPAHRAWPHHRLLPSLHSDLAGALHRDVAAIYRDACPTRYSQRHFLGRSDVDHPIGCLELKRLLGSDLSRPRLRLHIYGPLRSNHRNPLASSFASGLNRAREDANGLARMHANLATDRPMGVLATGDGGRVVAAQMHVLARRDTQSGLAHDSDIGIGHMGHLSQSCSRIAASRVGQSTGQTARVDHARETFAQGRSRCGMFIECALILAYAAC